MHTTHSTGVRQLTLESPETAEHGGHRYPVVGTSTSPDMYFAWAFHDKRNAKQRASEARRLFIEMFGYEPDQLMCCADARAELGDVYEGMQVSEAGMLTNLVYLGMVR